MNKIRVTLMCIDCGMDESVEATKKDIDSIYIDCPICGNSMLITEVELISELPNGERTTEIVAATDPFDDDDDWKHMPHKF